MLDLFFLKIEKTEVGYAFGLSNRHGKRYGTWIKLLDLDSKNQCVSDNQITAPKIQGYSFVLCVERWFLEHNEMVKQ